MDEMKRKKRRKKKKKKKKRVRDGTLTIFDHLFFSLSFIVFCSTGGGEEEEKEKEKGERERG